MRIAVVNEGSTKHRNADVLRALDGLGHEIVNAGMKNTEGEPDLNYLETGLISALALNLKLVDFVVGGCGTGQGYMNAVLQFPNVFCGLLLDPTDAWLYAQVNAGNCVSLSLNKGYGGVGADLNLRILFAQLFKDPFGGGYPPHRREIQASARGCLERLSSIAHRDMADILPDIDRETLRHALSFPGVMAWVETADGSDPQVARLKAAARQACSDAV